MIKITNNADSALVQITGDIGNSFWSEGWTLKRFQDQLAGLSVSNVVVEISSMGGDLLEGFAIHDAIKNLPARVTAKIVGATASAATVIATAADRIEISENSRYLVHNAQTFIAGNKEQLGEAYAELESFDNQILDIYVKRTGKPRNELAELMKQEKWMTSAEALEWGFVDEIIKPKITNKIENVMTPEEIAALQAENEQLKKDLADVQQKLAEMEAGQQAQQEQAITEAVENAVKDGKINNEAKDTWIEMGKSIGITNMTAALEGVKFTATPTLTIPEDKGEKMTEETFWKNYKEGKYANNKEQYDADYKSVFKK